MSNVHAYDSFEAFVTEQGGADLLAFYIQCDLFADIDDDKVGLCVCVCELCGACDGLCVF